MAKNSGRANILRLLLTKVGVEVTRADIIKVAGISEWARRIRELSQIGWDIETTSNGYILKSATQQKVDTKRLNISGKQRYRILKRDNSRCRRCGRTIDDGVKLVVDHVIPVDWGGATEDQNLWTLCEECNLGKKAYESDADAGAMKMIMGIGGARDRLREYFKFKKNQVCTREEIQIVAGISEYARRIRELRAEGMDLTVANARGDYIYRA